MTETAIITNVSPKIEIQHLFKIESNRDNFRRLYRFLSYPQRGFILCQSRLAEQSKILYFFKSSSLKERIYMLDMADPPLNPISLQEKIIQVHEKHEPRRNIFFIYNIDSCMKLLKIKEEEFFERLNIIRDFFSQFDSLFVFFFSEDFITVLIRHAFDFYDWFKLRVVFQPEPILFYPVAYMRSLAEHKVLKSKMIRKYDVKKFIDIDRSWNITVD
ncbi:MAG: hypothetical protein JSV88_27760 [Candidatus Aminicenantes bacterium]|nr:MAG: hypothetical protein JSV88_27760 [Candidatus Aminicenantes bacterium]